MVVILLCVGVLVYMLFSRVGSSWSKRTSADPVPVEKKGDPDGGSTHVPALAPQRSRAAVVRSAPSYARPEKSTVFFVHKFKNRLAPKVPNFLGEKSGVGIALDSATNTWIVESDESQAHHLRAIVEMLDIAPEELDLDFVLLAVSEKWIRSIGVNLTFNEGANYLSSVGIYDTSGGLRFASGSVAVNISGERANEHVSVYRTPCIRVLEGEPWQLSETVEAPIPVTQTIDGVSTTSIQYTSLGLTLQGRVSKGTKGWRLDLEQGNGSKGADVRLDQYTVPERRTQLLKTAVYIEPNKWTVCGGVRNIEQTTKSGLLYSKKGFTKDLILIFCRPRTSLRKVYKAVPVWPSKPNLSADGNPSVSFPRQQGVLPPKPKPYFEK